MPVVDSVEWLEISGLPLYTPAWIIRDHTPLRQGPTQMGRNRRLSRGRVVPLPRYPTETTLVLPLTVYGFSDSDGIPYADPRAGLDVNIAVLNANVDAAVAVGDGTRPAVWHRVDGTTRAAAVQSSISLGERKGAICKGSLTLIIPAGSFV